MCGSLRPKAERQPTVAARWVLTWYQGPTMTWVSSWPPSRCFKYFRWPRVIVPQSAGLGGRTPAAVPAAASAAAPGPSPAAPPAAVAAASAPALPIYQYFDPSTAVSAAARQSLCATGATAPCCAVLPLPLVRAVFRQLDAPSTFPSSATLPVTPATALGFSVSTF